MDFPEVDYQEVAKNLVTRMGTEISELKYQNAQLESMLVALKANRDNLAQEAETLRTALMKPTENAGEPDGV